MRKWILTSLTILLLAGAVIAVQESEADMAYIKAVTSPDAATKVRLLKDYVSTYGGKGTRYENFAYATLCITPYNGKTQQETIDYGEKALAAGGLDDLTISQVNLTLSGLYAGNGQNLEKAKTYALNVVQTAQKAKNQQSESENAAQWNTLIGAGYYAHGQASEKSGDIKSAAKSYVRSYSLLKNAQILNDIKRVGKELYDTKQYADAEDPFKIACQTNTDFATCALYANTLYRIGKKDEALKYFKQAYTKQKNGDIAYNIGIILAGKTSATPSIADEAIKYLLDASFLSQTSTQKAMQLAQGLYFNTVKKSLQYNEKINEIQERAKRIEELTTTFNSKFGDKTVEDLSDQEKTELEQLRTSIANEQAALKKLEDETKVALEQFNQLIEQTKQRLGIK